MGFSRGSAFAGPARRTPPRVSPPGAVTPMIPPDQHIPLGSVQVPPAPRSGWGDHGSARHVDLDASGSVHAGARRITARSERAADSGEPGPGRPRDQRFLDPQPAGLTRRLRAAGSSFPATPSSRSARHGIRSVSSTIPCEARIKVDYAFPRRRPATSVRAHANVLSRPPRFSRGPPPVPGCRRRGRRSQSRRRQSEAPALHGVELDKPPGSYRAGAVRPCR